MFDPLGYLKDDEVVEMQKCCKAEDPKDLEDRIMNCNIPKSAAEWWAKNEIERLRAIVEKGATDEKRP